MNARDYQQYLRTLPSEDKCACGRARVGQCKRCSDHQRKESVSQHTDRQLTFGFLTTQPRLYDQER